MKQSSTMTTLSLKEYEDVHITVPWGHIAGRWYGNRQVRPILALHGWLDNLGTFANLIPLLPAHIGLLCIDLPGHGRSSHHPPGIRYSLIDFVPTIIYTMKQYNWQHVSLLAHSMGAAICFVYASLYPQTVDMLISIDVIIPPINELRHLNSLTNAIDQQFIEDERIAPNTLRQPPANTYAELERKLYEGSFKSVNPENTKHLLDRSIRKSELFPNKYYFSRDGRAKYYQFLAMDPGMAAEMARRIVNVPFLVIKATDSNFINRHSEEVINILTTQNSRFHLREIKGTHYVHLNNAAECAEVIVPFLDRYGPVQVDSRYLAKGGKIALLPKLESKL